MVLHLGVVNEALARARVWWEVTSARLVEALDDCLVGKPCCQYLQLLWHNAHRFTSAILPNNEREGLVKLDHILIVRAERADALDEHLSCCIMYL